jgi:hypothetical protein
MPFDVWLELGVKLAMYSNATAWWLGDWLIFGRAKYGRRYKTAVAATRLGYQTLRNYAVVARRFEPSRRRADLSFQHHAELCALDDAEQDRWLDRAAAHGWSRNEMRRRLRAELGTGHERSSRVVRLAIEPAHLRRWREAASLCGSSLDAWMLRVLDDAAGIEVLDLDGCAPCH